MRSKQDVAPLLNFTALNQMKRKMKTMTTPKNTNTENTSGLRAVEYKVLIKPVEVAEKTKGGIILPDSAKEKEEFARSEGVIVAVGEIAFTDPDWLNPPKVEDLVLFDKFAGSLVTGVDGETYRLINDKEIGAVIL